MEDPEEPIDFEEEDVDEEIKEDDDEEVEEGDKSDTESEVINPPYMARVSPHGMG